MRAEKERRRSTFGQVEIEGVHVVADRMKFGNVERFEIVVGRFDFGAFDNGEADGNKDVFDFLQDLADQVMGADGALDAGERGSMCSCERRDWPCESIHGLAAGFDL